MPLITKIEAEVAVFLVLSHHSSSRLVLSGLEMDPNFPSSEDA